MQIVAFFFRPDGKRPDQPSSDPHFRQLECRSPCYRRVPPIVLYLRRIPSSRNGAQVGFFSHSHAPPRRNANWLFLGRPFEVGRQGRQRHELGIGTVHSGSKQNVESHEYRFTDFLCYFQNRKKAKDISKKKFVRYSLKFDNIRHIYLFF